MSSYLADALGRKQSEFGRTVAELENTSGNPSEDVRLASELIAKTRQKISELGLDPDDTTSEELYEALNLKFARQHEAFSRSLGGQPDAETITDLFSHFETQGVWTPKGPFLKKALISHPPKKLMKALHYRTAESMMKRENPAKIAAAAGISESPSWISDFEKQINKVAASDWQIGPINILLFENSPWSELPGKKSVQISCVAGSVILRPNLSTDSDNFCLTLKLIQAIETLTSQSQATVLRLLGETQNYGLDMTGQNPGVKVGGLKLALSEYELGNDDVAVDAGAQSGSQELPAVSIWQQFYRLHPALSWWKDGENLLFVGGDRESVSFNLLDVAKNATNSLSFSRREVSNGRRRLEDSLAKKYASHHPSVTMQQAPVGNAGSPRERLKQLQIRYGAAFAVGSVS